MNQNQLESLRAASAGAGGRLYVGSVEGGLALADPEQAVLVLGPPRSGKTTALAVPNVLAAPGAVVATSTKPDVMAATLGARSEVGRCWLLDPTGSVTAPPGVGRVRWSPVAGATTWDDSLVLARAMTGAARPFGRRGETAHWTERAEALLAPLLHAAFLTGGGIESVLKWVLRQELEKAQAALIAEGVDIGSDVLAGIAATDYREQSGIWSSAAGILAAYRSDAVLDNSAAPNFDPMSLTATADTVYVCAPARQQDLVAPIVVAFLDRARAGCYEAAKSPPRNNLEYPGNPRAAGWQRTVSSCFVAGSETGVDRRPVTLVLDEVANIAPLPDLPAIVSEGGSQGLLTLACLQDLSQARARWGGAADGFITLFGAKVVLPGIGDVATLDLISRLGGEVDVPGRTVSRAPWWTSGGGAETVTWAPHRQRRLPMEAVAQQRPGTALLLAGARPPESVSVPPWWALPVFQAGRARGADRTVGPPEGIGLM